VPIKHVSGPRPLPHPEVLVSRRTSRYSSTDRRKAVKPLPQMPTLKQMQTVDCPACNAPAGTPCTIRGGHQARVHAYRAATGVPAQQAPPAKASDGNKPWPAARACAICRKPLGKQPTANTKSGKTCHASCLTQAQKAGSGEPAAPRQWNTAAAEREFARNKARIEDGQTFRARQSTGWKLGGSPSSAGETTR
jgi:hypothetical protein